MLWSLKTHFSLSAIDDEARADQRIHLRAMEVFVTRETMNSYLAQFVFAIIASAGYWLDIPSVLVIGVLHVLVDQLVRHNLGLLSGGLRRGEIDARLLRRIERIFYGVGFVWAMAAWPLAEALDGLRLLLTVVSAAGLLVMANTTCHAPRVFRTTVVGFALGVAVLLATI